MLYHEIYHLLVLLLVLGLHITFLNGHNIQKRNTSCPVYWDRVWQQRDERCPDGQKYHCFTNEDNDIESEGCFEQKECLQGAHPVAESTYIVCRICRSGFQKINGLKSSEYTYSYCEAHHAPCNPAYGQVECQAPTAQRDRACSCSRSLGFSPRVDGELCRCFTTNDPCSGCKFVGCLDGTVKNSRGFCEPAANTTVGTTTSVSTTWRPTTPSVSFGDGDDGLSDGAIAAIVLFPLVVIAVIVFVLYRKRERILGCLGMSKEDSYRVVDQPSSQTSNGTSPPEPPQPITMTKPGNVFITTGPATFVLDKLGEPPKVNIENVEHFRVSVGGNKGDSAFGLKEDIPAAAASNHGDAETGPQPCSERDDVLPPEPGSATLPSAAGTKQEPLLPFPTEASEHSIPPPSSPVSPPSAPPLLPTPSAPPPSLPMPSAPPPSLPMPSAPPPSLPMPSAPPPSLPMPSAPPPSLPMPSAPPPSLPMPSAPPPYLPMPSAPPPSLPMPSAPPPLPMPSAPPPSLPMPSAPPPSLPEMDKGDLDNSSEDTERKVPFYDDENTVPKRRLSGYDETSAKTVVQNMDETVSSATESEDEAEDRTGVKANSFETEPLLAAASVSTGSVNVPSPPTEDELNDKSIRVKNTNTDSQC